MLAMSRSDLEKLEPGDLLSFRRSLWMRENWKAGSRAGGAFARSRDAFSQCSLMFLQLILAV